MIDKQEWLEYYRTNKQAVWIICVLTNGETFFNDKFEGWLQVKAKCDRENLYLKEFYLQFRSHRVEIDVEDTDGFYFIRSILGSFGEDSKQMFTTGIVDGDQVHKVMWSIPELVEDRSFVDNKEDCFEEALLINEKRTK